MEIALTKMTDDLFHNIIIDYFNGKEVKIEKDYDYAFGTHEWCDTTFNSSESCYNKCWYCYAWIDAYFRGRDGKDSYGEEMMEKEEWWKTWGDRESKFVVMYPSTHDTNIKNMAQVFFNISLMMCAKNIHCLYVTKPDYEVIKLFVKLLEPYKDRITFRLTMTTNDEEQIKFWESKAPSFESRMKSLKTLYKHGFNTSVSIEPWIIPKGEDTFINNTISYIDSLLPHIRDVIWIGMMNHVPVNQYHEKPLEDDLRKRFESVTENYTDKNIMDIVHHYYTNKKIRFKESIKKRMINLIRSGYKYQD